jgi:hypothetical protein
MRQYRLLTGEDTSAFCRKVSAALAEGWELYGSPAYAWDAANGVMRCAQAVVRPAPDGRTQAPGTDSEAP